MCSENLKTNQNRPNLARLGWSQSAHRLGRAFHGSDYSKPQTIGLDLTRTESTQIAQIGPICRTKWGLGGSQQPQTINPIIYLPFVEAQVLQPVYLRELCLCHDHSMCHLFCECFSSHCKQGYVHKFYFVHKHSMQRTYVLSMKKRVYASLCI